MLSREREKRRKGRRVAILGGEGGGDIMPDLSAPITAVAQLLDARVNLKHVHRQCQAVAKTLIVTTFLEDSIRCLITFSVQQQSMRIAGWQDPFWHTASIPR